MPGAFAGTVSVEPPTCEILAYNPITHQFSVQVDDDGEICFLQLSAGQQNLVLNNPLKGCDFTPPVNFTVDVVDTNLPASGNIIVEDGVYNSVTDRCQIDLPISHPEEDSPGGWGEDIATQIMNGEKLYGYLASGEDSMHVYDVSDPTNVQFVSTETPGAGDCDPVAGYPDYYADSITIVQGGDLPFDITNPAEISQAFHFKPPSWTEAVDTFVDSENETVYLYAATFWGGLKIYGQTNPINNPAAFGEIGTWGVNDPAIGAAIDLEVEFRNNMILVHVLTDVGLRTVDVTDPANPVEIGNFEFDPLLGESGEGMAIIGNRAFIALWQGGLLVLNIQDPTNPSEIDTIPTDLAIYSVTTNGLGTRLYAAEGLFGLWTFWINPDNLVEQSPSPIDVGDGAWAWAWAWAWAERDRIVYVPYGYLGDPLTGGFQIFEYEEDPCGNGFEQSLVVPMFVYWSVRRRRRRRA